MLINFIVENKSVANRYLRLKHIESLEVVMKSEYM